MSDFAKMDIATFYYTGHLCHVQMGVENNATIVQIVQAVLIRHYLMRIAEGSDLKVGVLRFVGVKLKEVLCHTIFDVSDTLYDPSLVMRLLWIRSIQNRMEV
jgi:hypothetical protein